MDAPDRSGATPRVNPPDERRLVAGLDAAIRWLLESGIRSPDGGLRSIRRARSGEYVTYGGGLSCLQCTAGAVMAFLAAARGPGGSGPDAADCLAAALTSAEHLLALMRAGSGADAGMIPDGLQSENVKVLHTEAAIRAFLEIHEATGDARWSRAAAAATRWAVRTLQNADGSFRSGYFPSLRGRVRSRVADVRHCGCAAYVRTLSRVSKLTGDPEVDRASSRLLGWLRGQADREGALPMYRYGPISRLAASRRFGGWAEVWHGCLRYHPSPNAWMIEALLTAGDEAGARRISEWFVPRIGPNGLLYQYYFAPGVTKEMVRGGLYAPGGLVSTPYGTRSVEEDVMPTAALGIHWMARRTLLAPGRLEELLGRIAEGILYAQVIDEGRGRDGGVRGLPLHPEFNDDLYAWDTVYAVLFLTEYLAFRSAARAVAA